MTASFLLGHLPAILAEFPNISLVYLFGSRVTGHTGPLSDYDLAIVIEDQENDASIQFHFQHAVSKLLNTDRVDVVLLNHAPIDLAYQVIANGKLLHQKNLFTRVEFEAQTLSKFGDYLPILRFFNRQSIKGDTHGKRAERYREALGRTQRTLSEARTAARSTSR